MTTQAAELTAATAARASVGDMVGQVEKRMRRLIDEERARWSDVCRGAAVVPVDEVARLVEAGGKRLRPMFCVTGYLAAGGAADDKTIIDAAAALEFLHAFALIHDDVLDDSPLRRGIATVHVRHASDHATRGWRGESRRYGEGVAILAGDLAHVYADRLAAGIPRRAREIWGDLRTEMIVGQFVDIAAAAEFTADPALARWIALCKSGRYTIHRPLQLGAAIAGRADLAPAFERYGAAVGEAFQLRDDLLGAFGDSRRTGKPIGLDLAQHKVTLLIAMAIEADGGIGGLLLSQPDGGADPARLRAALDRLDTPNQVERRIEFLVEEARTAIAVAPLDSCWRDELAEMACQVAFRAR